MTNKVAIVTFSNDMSREWRTPNLAQDLQRALQGPSPYNPVFEVSNVIPAQGLTALVTDSNNAKTVYQSNELDDLSKLDDLAVLKKIAAARGLRLVNIKG